MDRRMRENFRENARKKETETEPSKNREPVNWIYWNLEKKIVWNSFFSFVEVQIRNWLLAKANKFVPGRKIILQIERMCVQNKNSTGEWQENASTHPVPIP